MERDSGGGGAPELGRAAESPGKVAVTPAPRAVFSNLFRIELPPGGLDPIKQSSTRKARKTDLVRDYRRPWFYETRRAVLAYGPELDSFDDPRFTRAIIMPDRERAFARYLVKYGLISHLRSRGYPVRPTRQGFLVLDHMKVTASDANDRVALHPEYGFQVNFLSLETELAAEKRDEIIAELGAEVLGDVTGCVTARGARRAQCSGTDVVRTSTYGPSCPVLRRNARSSGSRGGRVIPLGSDRLR